MRAARLISLTPSASRRPQSRLPLRTRTRSLLHELLSTLQLVVHTLTCCTHIFLHVARAQSHSHIFMRVTYTHGSSVCKMVSAYVSFLPISPSLSRVSPILAVLAHFETTFPSAPFLPYLPVPEAQGMRNSARGRAVWLLSAQKVRQDHFRGQ